MVATEALSDARIGQVLSLMDSSAASRERSEPLPDAQSLRAYAIVNGSARSGEGGTQAARVEKQLTRAGAPVTLKLTDNGDEVHTAVNEALEAGANLILAGGGDGTINCVAGHLVERNVVLGVLPLGTLNHFAKDLRLPLEIDAALKTALNGATKRVDVGEVNGRYFLNNSSLGLYPSMVRLRDKQQAHFGMSKWRALFWASLSVLRRYPFLDLTLNIDGKTIKRRTPFVLIGNNEYQASGLSAGERARLDAGVLSVYVAHRTGRWGLVKLALRVLTGRVKEAKDFDALTATELLVESRHKRLFVSTDGEVTLMESPFRYRIHPAALKVRVPQTTT